MNEPYCRCAGCGECSAHRKEPKLKARIEALERERDRNLDSINVGNTIIINKQRERITELEAKNAQLLEVARRVGAMSLMHFVRDGEDPCKCARCEIVRQARAAIAEASTQPEIQTDTLERKDAALRVALEALQLTMVPLREYKAEEARKARNAAIAKIKEAL